MILKLVGMFTVKHDADISWWYKQGSREEYFFIRNYMSPKG